MTEYDQKAAIEGQSFTKMREDANRVLQKLLKNMVEKSTNEGTLTIKIDVTFVQEFLPIPPEQRTDESGYTRRVLKPQFKHKISSTMQVKDDASGDSKNETMELVWDPKTESYILTPIKGEAQMNIFDVMKDQEDSKKDEEGDGDTEEDDQKQINGRTFLQLPPPEDAQEGSETADDDEDEVIDAEYREVAPSDDGDDVDVPDDDDSFNNAMKALEDEDSFGGYEYQEPGDDEWEEEEE